MRIALVQLNPTVGDLKGNLSKAINLLNSCRDCSLLVFPEMFITGFPPGDLLLRSDFISAVDKTVDQFIRASRRYKGLSILMGAPYRVNGRLYNACLWFQEGKLRDIYLKRVLWTHNFFDERRYFAEGDTSKVWCIDGIRIFPAICEDMSGTETKNKVVSDLIDLGPDLVITISASLFHIGKLRERVNIASKISVKTGCPMIYANLIGGQDGLIFDGGTFFLNGRDLKILIPQFREGVVKFDFPSSLSDLENRSQRFFPPVEEAFEALVLGVRDYVNKNRFEKVLIGLSGGIDSSLTAVIAVEALGPERVVGVSMPSRYNSRATRRDVKRLVENLGIKCIWIGIERIFSTILAELSPIFDNLPMDVTEENIQARIRATILMALSNKFGWLVLNTGNKSELSVGYGTLYGDLAGGLGVLKDVPKTLVWRLARYYNRIKKKAIIPLSVIRRPPSAELRYNQRDEESLLPYPVLDKIIDAYVEKGLGCEEIVSSLKIEREAVERIIRLIFRSEYKRHQGPPGIKITPLDFERDWRMPITNAFDPADW